MKDTKEKISGNYMLEIQKKYINKRMSNKRAALLCGASKKNIIEQIGKAFDDNIKIHKCDLKTGIDFRNIKEVELLIDDFIKNNPKADILIVGHSIMQLKWFEEYSYDEMHNIINTNLISTMNIINVWINKTINLKHKKYIVLVGSMAYINVLNGS